jgi:hypothetical protein
VFKAIDVFAATNFKEHDRWGISVYSVNRSVSTSFDPVAVQSNASSF